MSVNKELLERYKQLKAQGVNVSLSELKKQMEEENTCATKSVTGFSALSTPVETAYSTAQTDTAPAFVSSFNPAQTKSLPITAQSADYNKPAAAGLNNDCYLQEQKTAHSEYTGNVTSTPAAAAPEIKKYAVIGYPLGHSLSGYIHDAGFKSLGMKATYDILETPPESLVDRIKFLKTNNYSGFNVTIPLKLPVTMFLDEVDTSADIVNAVNTVAIDPATRALKGYNTDVTGFRNAIPDDIVPAGKSCGILGTGGAARAAITALCQSQVKSIKLFTRNIPNCIELLNFLRGRFPNVEFTSYQIEHIRDLSDIQFLVNTTPIGMLGRAADLTPVEERELTTLPEGAVVYDVIYNPKKTVLLKLAQKHGYRTINGVDMFIRQAVAAEQIWTGKTPDFKDMKIAALENL